MRFSSEEKKSELKVLRPKFNVHISGGFLCSRERPFKIGNKNFRTVERATSKWDYFGFLVQVRK
jgi:hypothetical protein